MDYCKVFIKKETLAQIFSCEFCEISKDIFSTEHLQTTASEFLQKYIDKFKECQTNESTKKIQARSKKGKVWNRGKRTQMPVTVTEGLAVTDKG